MHRLFARVLAFPRLTVAAVNGHAVAGGFMLALARGLVDEVAEEAAVLPRAIALAAELAAKDPATLAGLERGLHGETLRLLETPAGLASAG